MAEISETMVKILERITATHEQLIEILQRMEERQQEHNLTLAKVIGENSLTLAKGMEENSLAMQQSLGHIADVLKYVAEITSRTERMTAEVLARLALSDPAHWRDPQPS